MRTLAVIALMCFACGDGVIQNVRQPPRDRGILSLVCGSARIMVGLDDKPIAACRRGQERDIILSEGLYHLRFYAPGHYAQYKVVAIEAGKVTSIHIQLLKAPE